MTTGAQLIFLELGFAAGALENMPLRLQFRLCGSLTFRRLAGANAGRLPLSPSRCCRAASRNLARRRSSPCDRLGGDLASLAGTGRQGNRMVHESGNGP
jgi:hypothetical protein